MPSQDFTPYEGLLPEDGTPTAGVRVVAFLEGNGQMRYGVGITGDAPLSTYLGLLIMAQRSLLKTAEEEWGLDG